MNNSEKSISINEHLSAMLDDEAGSFEQRRVLDELISDKQLSQKLSNFAMIGETMRMGESEKPVQLLGSQFLDSIHEKIAHEDAYNEVVIESENNTQATQTNTDSNSSWFRPIGGFALAASIGALAIMGLQNTGILNNNSAPIESTADGSSQTEIANSTPVSLPAENDEALIKKQSEEIAAAIEDQYVEADAQTRAMLKRYVDTHMQYATTSTFVPSVRVIAYTDNQ